VLLFGNNIQFGSHSTNYPRVVLRTRIISQLTFENFTTPLVRSGCCPVSERLAKQLTKKISASFELTGKPQWENFCLANRSVTGHGPGLPTIHFYSAPQCSHCMRCTSYGNSVRPSHAGIVLSKRLHVARAVCTVR